MPTVLSLFSGVGLHDLGLERAGWTIAGQVENDPWCSAVLAKHWPAVTRWEDIRHVTANAVLATIGRPGLIAGGFPCTDISLAGKGAGLSGDASGLWFEMLRLVRDLAPPWVLVENVPALRARGAWQVVLGLEEAGYTVLPPVVVGAWAAGATHRRDRVWIVAQRMGDAAQLGRGERRGRTEEPEQPTTGRSLPDGADPGALGMAHADRHHLRQLERREPAGRAPGTLRDGGETEPGGLRVEGRLADPYGEGLEEHGGEPGDPQPERSTALRGGGPGLANPDRGGRQRLGSSGILGRERQACGSHAHGRDRWPAWPAGRGEPQHPWEPPRIVEPGMGRGSDGRPARLDGFTRRNRLRALGNANPPDLPELIGRWILLEEAKKRSPGSQGPLEDRRG